jgi:hypothetical protein
MRCWIVGSAWIEFPYEGDPFSIPREAYSGTIHISRDGALERLLWELQHDMAGWNTTTLRRSFTVEEDIPDSLSGGRPHRWVSDRLSVMAFRAGIDMAAASRALFLNKNALRDRLVEDVCADLDGMTRSIASDDPDPMWLACRAMMAACSINRLSTYFPDHEVCQCIPLDFLSEIGRKALDGTLDRSDTISRIKEFNRSFAG